LLKGNENVRLVVAGNIQDEKEYNKVLSKIKKFHISDFIEFKGYVDDEELDNLYKNCKAVIYPSLYEGFGYNILEAFYYSKPLITSNISSMPEIAKDAAIYVDPNSKNSIADAMLEVINNHKKSIAMAKKGNSYLRFYKIDKMIKDTIKAYEYFANKK
jgi:glycosyltransferase involved in cell wall biosynthesis